MTTTFKPELSADGLLRHATRAAFLIGAGGVAMAPATVLAQAATPAPASDQPAELEKIEVTGSRIKRVDLETSNPVFTMDRKAIENTGIQTLGDLLQALPIVTGAVTNTQVNNGGGTGAADVSLRGLEAKRTLVLVDGRRFVGEPSVDINSLPTNIIDRIEILKEGASAIYGSDAIGGVVNIITRRNYTGTELFANYGTSAKSDATKTDLGLTWGTSGADSSVVWGANYNRNTAIKSGDRFETSAPWGLYYGNFSPNVGTSSRTPFGRYGVGAAVQAAAGVVGNPCGTVTRINGTPGTTGSDFRCFNNTFGPFPTDRYNFQPENLALTPSIRGSVFALADKKLADWVTGYGSVVMNNTKANNQLAAEPFDNGTVQALQADRAPVFISKDSVYNVFGDQYLGAGNGQDVKSYALRAVAAGDRVSIFDTTATQGTAGLRGDFAGSNFRWDVNGSYGRILTTTDTVGFLNFSQLGAQMGPSFDNADNDPTNGVQDPMCGTPAAPIRGCKPLDVMGISANDVGMLNANTHVRAETQEKVVEANVTNDALVNLPAGPLGGNIGVQYRSLSYDLSPDALGQTFSLSEANSLPTHGSYNVREAYGEVAVPIVSGLPGIESLMFTPGVRFSKYSTFGNTTNAKYGLEYRPIKDVLLRGNYADVFRAPNTIELFSGAAQTAPLYTDPCNGLGGAKNHPGYTTGTDPNIDLACQNVPTTGTFKQQNPQATTNIVGTPTLDAETGHATNYGIVYSPSWFDPMTIELDVWQVKLDKAIEIESIQTSVDACFNNGILCNNIQRDTVGQLSLGTQPYLNTGKFDTKGVDFGVRFNFQNTGFGNVKVYWDTTYLDHYDLTESQNGIQLANNQVAGLFDANVFGASFPRVRSVVQVYWDMGPWNVSVFDKYIGKMKEFPTDGGSSATFEHDIAAANYINVAGGYKLAPLGMEFTVGVKDLFDQGANLVYNGFNGATDTGAYDITGTNYYAKVQVNFK